MLMVVKVTYTYTEGEEDMEVFHVSFVNTHISSRDHVCTSDSKRVYHHMMEGLNTSMICDMKIFCHGNNASF